MKNRIVSLLISVAVLLLAPAFLPSCQTGSVYKSEEYTDIATYSQMWEMSELHSDLLLFPKEVSESDVKSFYCWKAEYKWTGTGYQICLTVHYEGDAFSNEIERIRNTESERPVRLDETNLSKPAYVAVWAQLGVFEYVLVDEANQEMTYVFLQLLTKENIKLDSTLLPNGYEAYLDYPESEAFSIYNAWGG